MKIKRRQLVLGIATALLIVIAVLTRPVVHLFTTRSHDVDSRESTPPGFADDASRLNQTRVAAVWQIPTEVDAASQLQELLARARSEGKQVSIAGARHSMGGHTIIPNGIVIDMRSWNQMELDAERNILHVQSGATWKDVIAYLDARGRSVEVMQSNNSFTVGGSISVNCHGWQFDRPPIASTVDSFRIMQADGSLVDCSRSENQELFSLALGGYGLFGIILDVDLRVVPNECYRLEQVIVPIHTALAKLDALVRNRQGLQMVYGRMNIVPETFLNDVIINAFVVDDQHPIPPLMEPGMETLRRAIFRGSAESDYGKQLRWAAETKLQPWLTRRVFSRNQLLNEGVELFQNRSSDSTDILHEYFVPRQQLAGFVSAMRKIVPRHNANLLNVTVRAVREDVDTFLRYADQPMFAFVMLFVQDRTPDGESRMQALTRDLIDTALQHERRYYLPYRLHATREQFQQAYPQAELFFELKRRYDPDELFQNEFYRFYGLGTVATRSPTR